MLSKNNCLFCVLVVSIIINGCATSLANKALLVDGLIFINSTATTIHDVRLEVENSHGFIACGYILIGENCSTTFPIREYQSNAVKVSWVQNGQQITTNEFYIELPYNPDYAKSVLANVTIQHDGKISAVFVQE